MKILDPAIRWAHRIAVASLLILIGYYLLLTLYLTPLDKAPSPAMAGLLVIPLLAFLPALLLKNHRGMIGLCFVILLYFVSAVLNVFSPIYGVLAYLDVAATVILFVSTMIVARWKLKQRA